MPSDAEKCAQKSEADLSTPTRERADSLVLIGHLHVRCKKGSAHSNPRSSTITLRHQSHNSASYGTSARHFTIVMLPRFCGPRPEPLSRGLSQTAASNFQSMWRPWKAPSMTWAILTLKCTVDTHIEGFGAITTVCVELCVSLHHSELPNTRISLGNLRK